MRVTVVPNRNAIMLSIAFAVAAAHGDEAVATAVHSGDHFIYPDCRPAFTQAFELMQKAALEGYADVSLYTPFVHRTKADIVIEGARHNTRLLRKHGHATKVKMIIVDDVAPVWNVVRLLTLQASRTQRPIKIRISGPRLSLIRSMADVPDHKRIPLFSLTSIGLSS